MTVVTASSDRVTGSRASRRLRREGRIPGVIYGEGIESTAVHVEYTDLREATKGPAGLNSIFTLEVDGTQHTVILKRIQRDPIKRTVSHADFLRVDDVDEIKIIVPVVVKGRAVKVLDSGGIIEQKMHQLRVKVDPRRIPDQIEADVSGLTLDTRLALGDLDLPEGVTPMVPDNITVAAPVVPRGLKSMSDEDEDEDELAEGEAAEGAEGDAGDGDADGDGDDE